MPVIDVQVHPFARNHPGRPWASPSHGLDSAKELLLGIAAHVLERQHNDRRLVRKRQRGFHRSSFGDRNAVGAHWRW